MIKWEKASYGGSDKGGKKGRIDFLPGKGNKGLPPISGVEKAKVSRGGSVIDAPQEKGNKGIDTGGASHSYKAPLD